MRQGVSTLGGGFDFSGARLSGSEQTSKVQITLTTLALQVALSVAWLFVRKILLDEE